MTPTDAPDRVMLDLETLGTDPGCAILSIGAVRFDADGPTEDTFHRSVDLASCQDAGLSIDAGTLAWWLDRDDDAKAVLTGGDPLRSVLEDFAAFYGTASEIWAFSPAFDCAILAEAYDAVGIVEPWSYQDERCARTIASLDVAVDPDHDGTAHDALDDAIRQAEMVAGTLARLSEVES